MRSTKGNFMTRVTIEEAQQTLFQLIQKAGQGEEIVILEDERPIARLTPIPRAEGTRQRGSAKGLILSMAEDFDAPLDDFNEYM
jgi:antitoxin (DNA-binding transcriptional repressor) of toxin-antitoxin stability system